VTGKFGITPFPCQPIFLTHHRGAEWRKVQHSENKSTLREFSVFRNGSFLLGVCDPSLGICCQAFRCRPVAAFSSLDSPMDCWPVDGVLILILSSSTLRKGNCNLVYPDHHCPACPEIMLVVCHVSHNAFPPTEELLPHRWTSWPVNKITCGLEECGCVSGEESKYESVESSEITYSYCCTECWLQISDVYCLIRSSATLYHEASWIVGDKSDPAIWQECVEMWSRVLKEGQFVCLYF